MRNAIWDRRLPTLLGLLAIVVGVFATSLLVKNGAIFQGKAAPEDTPLDVRISNISDMSFTVSYTTQAAISGSVTYGKDKNLGNSAFDQRDQEGKPGAYTLHYINVKNLEPSTMYFFEIISNDAGFLRDGSLFQITTGPSIAASSDQQSLSGKIITPDGQNPKEAIAYVTSDGDQTLSTLIGNDGTYSISLKTMRTQDLNSLASSPQRLQILAIGDSLSSTATVLASQSVSVPTITLSKNYDFTISNSQTTSSASASLLFPSFTATASATFPSITNPKQDVALSDQQPTFAGTAKPGATVTISIKSSNEIQTQVTADQNGNWNYRPDTPLNPGQHTITITAVDNLGIIKTITQSFTVYAAGSQVGENATPSATLTPTLTATPTANITGSPTPTPSPIASPSASLTPTPVPTNPPLPATGNSVLDKGVLGLLTMAFGALAFFLARLKTL